MQPHDLIVDAADVIPGLLPDGTPMGRFCIETANLGELHWMLSPRQALLVAARLEAFGVNYSGMVESF
ncbi:hypothetical protein [[Mycobacterium] crassicus]|uniref:Uncharacterized protein n=1 Tax=[Mycobacterium] crassicus TaxID=2872309 RepID=A0ABU5XQ68_9MYCO|nr:hypothetical protein [Mycolicibacter sp. MYC098]MEB3023922.1 hypothetical protein [Mycolicibacter sp. MYC098]